MASKAARGKRAKTRNKISRKGPKVTVNKLLQEIAVGRQVDIVINASVQGSGMPFRRFHGMTGTVVGKQGSAFRVSLYQGNQPVELIVGPAHLRVSAGVQAPQGRGEDDDDDDEKVAA